MSLVRYEAVVLTPRAESVSAGSEQKKYKAFNNAALTCRSGANRHSSPVISGCFSSPEWNLTYSLGINKMYNFVISWIYIFLKSWFVAMIVEKLYNMGFSYIQKFFNPTSYNMANFLWHLIAMNKSPFRFQVAEKYGKGSKYFLHDFC